MTSLCLLSHMPSCVNSGWLSSASPCSRIPTQLSTIAQRTCLTGNVQASGQSSRLLATHPSSTLTQSPSRPCFCPSTTRCPRTSSRFRTNNCARSWFDIVQKHIVALRNRVESTDRRVDSIAQMLSDGRTSEIPRSGPRNHPHQSKQLGQDQVRRPMRLHQSVASTLQHNQPCLITRLLPPSLVYPTQHTAAHQATAKE